MAVPKRRTSKKVQKMRRSHIKLEIPGMTRCPNCNEYKLSHHVCKECGTYKGEDVMD